jgi:signal transduction histidine kinase
MACDSPDLSADLTAIASMASVQTLLQVVCRTTGLGFAAIARVTEDRWIACAVRDEIAFGLEPGGELAIATTLCNEVRAGEKAIVIDHVAEDEQYCGHPTPRQYGFQSYISVPILRANGEFFGTLCAIDPKPAQLKTAEILGTFELFAQLISRNLEAHDREAARELALQAERANASLRERFIAVLGHDLRNPLGAILSAATVLKKRISDPTDARMTTIIERSGARIGELVEMLLDLARSRHGDGLKATPTLATDLPDRLQQVIHELQSGSSDHIIVSDLSIDEPMVCDSRRIEQLLSNLISNAMTHGARPGTITVSARRTDQEFILSVANGGRRIPRSRLETIFHPFESDPDSGTAGGLGLGLYICTEISRAHRGQLTVTSDDEQTCFTFRMPVTSATDLAPQIDPA